MKYFDFWGSWTPCWHMVNESCQTAIICVIQNIFVSHDSTSTEDLNHLHSFVRFFSRFMCNDLIQWLFQIETKSLQYSIRNRYIQRTICSCIWLFFERSISAHLKNSLNKTNSYTQKVWWIIWETSGLPTREHMYVQYDDWK